jgi:hypothetical protein
LSEGNPENQNRKSKLGNQNSKPENQKSKIKT